MGLHKQTRPSIQLKEEYTILKRKKKAKYGSCIICKKEKAIVKPYCMFCFDLQQQGVDLKDYHFDL